MKGRMSRMKEALLLLMATGVIGLVFVFTDGREKSQAVSAQTQIENIQKDAFSSGVTVGLVLAKYRSADDPQEKLLWLSTLDAMKKRGMIFDQGFVNELVEAANKPEQKR